MNDAASDRHDEKLASLEQALRGRIHDIATEVQSLVTWREVHMIESRLRGEAVMLKLDDVAKHLSAQDKSIEGLKKQVTFWAGGLSALLAAVGIVVAVVELWPKK